MKPTRFSFSSSVYVALHLFFPQGNNSWLLPRHFKLSDPRPRSKVTRPIAKRTELRNKQGSSYWSASASWFRHEGEGALEHTSNQIFDFPGLLVACQFDIAIAIPRRSDHRRLIYPEVCPAVPPGLVQHFAVARVVGFCHMPPP